MKTNCLPPKPSKARTVRFEDNKEPPKVDQPREEYEDDSIYDTLPNIEGDSQGKKKKGRSWCFR